MSAFPILRLRSRSSTTPTPEPNSAEGSPGEGPGPKGRGTPTLTFMRRTSGSGLVVRPRGSRSVSISPEPPRHRTRTRTAAVFVAGAVAAMGTLFACGPFFPNSLLQDREHAVLQAPHVQFRRELDRLQLPAPAGIVHVPTAEDMSYRAFTLGVEISDLRRALGSRGTDTNVTAQVVLEFSRRRADVEEHRTAVAEWEAGSAGPNAHPEEPGTPDGPTTPGTFRRHRPELATWETPAALPIEFAQYLRGAEAWSESRTNEARAAWSTLLTLPAEARRFKSVWAAYMLGRSWHDADPGKAADYYAKTRRLVRTGYADTPGLATASFGWEGQLRLRTNDLVQALQLYLDQYAAGDTNSALNSIRYTCERVLASKPETRLAVARDPAFRRVVTAWALADQSWSSGWSDNAPESRRGAEDWLDTIDATGAAEVPLAEQMALLAYQVGAWESARRWIDLAADSPVAGWVRAKLMLREGRPDEAAAELARVVHAMPVEPEPRPRHAPPGFVDSLYVPDGDETNVEGRRQALGELGVLRLSRGEFVQSLDALLRAGFWQDAAHVAERVLTVDELRRYVDAHWPEAAPKAVRTGGRESPTAPAPEPRDESALSSGWMDHDLPEVQRRAIRHLLARRLVRAHRGREAAAYFPRALRADHARLLECLAQGQDSARPDPERARGWFAAACLVRTNGLELLGTELAPDFAIWGGEYDYGQEVAEAGGERTNGVARATAAERKRLEGKPADPDVRFHYRYQAASLAWDAARLLPNNDPETAMVLYRAGSWLKARDPETADVFYKALVRRCRKTELGDAADRQRWFPELDDEGRPVVTRVPPRAAEPNGTAP